MKKTTLAILALIISCATTNLNATVYMKNNKFYSPKPYYYTHWQYDNSSKLYFRFIHTTEDNKTYFRLEQKIKGRLRIGSDDYIIVVFEDGSYYRLDYCSEPVYYGYYSKIDKIKQASWYKGEDQFNLIITDDYSKVEAMGEIDNFTNITEIIFIKNGYSYYDSISIGSYTPDMLLEMYNDIILEVEKFNGEKNE